MAGGRLREPAKFILTKCYKTTVLLDNSGLVPLAGKHMCHALCQKCKSNGYNGADAVDNTAAIDTTDFRCQQTDDVCRNHIFFKEDILATYYELTKSEETPVDNIQSFATDKAYEIARNSVLVCLQGLKEKGQIDFVMGDNQIRLTNQGKEIAERLLANGYVFTKKNKSPSKSDSESIAKIKISDIKVRDGRRPVSESKAIEMAESIQELGLLNPITIDADYYLVAGAYRLKAIELLEHQEIAVNIVSLEGLRVELAEIDENFIRNDLHFLDNDALLARRKEIYP